jgi:hypothetical protein
MMDLYSRAPDLFVVESQFWKESGHSPGYFLEFQTIKQNVVP